MRVSLEQESQKSVHATLPISTPRRPVAGDTRYKYNIKCAQDLHEALCALTGWAPMLPTRPLVLRTLVLPSVLRLLGDERLPMLRLPMPLPPLPLVGVFGLVGLARGSAIRKSSSPATMGRFSLSLFSFEVRPSHLVVVVVVVVQLIARRFPLRLIGDWLAFRESIRSA